ncbi:MAG: hypothetical protein AAF152_02415 [Cyanobacteria bacterium P01_A01_bin.114]
MSYLKPFTAYADSPAVRAISTAYGPAWEGISIVTRAAIMTALSECLYSQLDLGECEYLSVALEANGLELDCQQASLLDSLSDELNFPLTLGLITAIAANLAGDLSHAGQAPELQDSRRLDRCGAHQHRLVSD